LLKSILPSKLLQVHSLRGQLPGRGAVANFCYAPPNYFSRIKPTLFDA
jgi:hypothetical protein